MSLNRLVLTSILGAEPDNMVALAQDVAQRVYWGRSGNWARQREREGGRFCTRCGICRSPQTVSIELAAKWVNPPIMGAERQSGETT